MNLFYLRFMICDMIPAMLVESKYFLEFLKCSNPKFNLPSRQTYAMIKTLLMSYLPTLYKPQFFEVRHLQTNSSEESWPKEFPSKQSF